MRIVFLLSLLFLSACGETAQRTVYETMKNAGQQQCLHQRDPAECSNKTEYDRYQKDRKTLDKNGN